MSAWIERLHAIEALEDAPLDAALLAELEREGGGVPGRPIRFSTPTFQASSSCELDGCGRNAFPAFSVTAGGCALDCDHCQAKILEPMTSIMAVSTPAAAIDFARGPSRSAEWIATLSCGKSRFNRSITG